MSTTQSASESQAFHEADDAFNSDVEANHLIKRQSPGKRSRHIETITVKPGEQPRIFLGNFTAADPPRGFSIEVKPDPRPAGSLVTQVTTLGTSKQYKLILLIANYGTKAVTAEVRQL